MYSSVCVCVHVFIDWSRAFPHRKKKNCNDLDIDTNNIKEPLRSGLFSNLTRLYKL